MNSIMSIMLCHKLFPINFDSSISTLFASHTIHVDPMSISANFLDTIMNIANTLELCNLAKFQPECLNWVAIITNRIICFQNVDL